MSYGAESLVQNLLLNGCNVCFANPGTSEMHFCKALDGNPNMRAILVLFEGVASGACLGYGLMAQRPAACLLHLVGGLGNALANLHNCKRSCAPTICIVGDHATHHQYDQHLQGDIISIARGVSKLTKHTINPKALVRNCNDCLRVSMQQPYGVSTLVLPADISWDENPPKPIKIKNSDVVDHPTLCSADAVARGVELLQACKVEGNGETLMILHGLRTVVDPCALQDAARIEAYVGCQCAVPTFNGRISRGPTIPSIRNVPYFSEQQIQFFKEVKTLVLINAQTPAGFFGYPQEERPGWTLPKDCKIVELALMENDGVDLLKRLADALGCPTWSVPSSLSIPTRSSKIMSSTSSNSLLNPEMPITPEKCNNIMQRLSPDGFVLSNEGNTLSERITKGLSNYIHYSELQLVGGAIGQGLPVAIGAAVACPNKKVIAIQADGSSMYTIQSLWTMARENLDICVVLLDNSRYSILETEFERMTGQTPNDGPAKQLFDLETSPGRGLDFVALARAQNVNGTRCTTVGEFQHAYEEAMSTKGPRMIHCVFRTPPEPSDIMSDIMPCFKPIGKPTCTTTTIPHTSFITPRSPLNAWRVLCRAAQLWGDQPAIISNSKTSPPMTYRKLMNQAKALGMFFKHNQIQRGDRIGILADNVGEVIVFHFACAYIGAVIVNLNVRLVSAELEQIIIDSSPKLVVACYNYQQQIFDTLEKLLLHSTKSSKYIMLQKILWIHEEHEQSTWRQQQQQEQQRQRQFSAVFEQFQFVDAIKELKSEDDKSVTGDSIASSEDPMHLYYTSGTTGTPKGVILSTQAVLDHAIACVAEFQMKATDVWGHFAPLYHVADAFAVLAITFVGGVHVMQSRYSPSNTWKAIARNQITITNLGSTMLTGMMQVIKQNEQLSALDFSALRMLSCGGSAVPERTIRSFCARLPHVHYFTSYGMTETCGKISFSLLSNQDSTATKQTQDHMLRPFMLIDIRIGKQIGEQFVPVAADGKQVGEVQVKGQTLFNGYWQNSHETKASFTSDGWFRTGDLAVKHEHGCMTVVDRQKDMVVVGGENVYTTEVENVLHAHQDVAEAAVYGMQNDLLGQVVHAAVKMSMGIDCSNESNIEELLISFCKTQLASFKVPYRIYIVSEIPKTGSGKIKRRMLQTAQRTSIYDDGSIGTDIEERFTDLYQGKWIQQELKGKSLETQPSSESAVLLIAGDGQDDRSSIFAYEMQQHRYSEVSEVSEVEMNEVGNHQVKVIEVGDHDAIMKYYDNRNKSDVSHVVYLSAQNITTMSPHETFYQVIELFKTLVQSSQTATMLKLWIVTLTSHPASNSLLTGVARSINAEIPNKCDCCMVDASALGIKEIVELLWQEINASNSSCINNSIATVAAVVSNKIPAPYPLRVDEKCESEIRYGYENVAEGGTQITRWAYRLIRLPSLQIDDAFQCNPSGQYLITGAFGGIGEALCLWLVHSANAKYLTLVTSRPVPIPDEDRRNILVEMLKTMGVCVTVMQCDCSDEFAVESVIKQVATNIMQLKGIFHLAGVHKDVNIMNLTEDDTRFIMAAKCNAAHAIHRATLKLDLHLDFLCFFSSMFSIVALPQLAPYTAANNYLNGLATLRNRQGRRTISVKWGVLEGPGMGGRLGSDWAVHWKSIGMDFLKVSQALGLLGHVLVDTSGQYDDAAVFSCNWDTFQQNVALSMLFNSLITGSLGTQLSYRSSSGRPSLNDIEHVMYGNNIDDAMGNVPENVPENVAENAANNAMGMMNIDGNSLTHFQRTIFAAVNSIVGHDYSDADFSTLCLEEFANLGVDSLLAPRLRRLVSVRLGVKIEASALNRFPTISKLAEHCWSANTVIDQKSLPLPKEDNACNMYTVPAAIPTPLIDSAPTPALTLHISPTTVNAEQDCGIDIQHVDFIREEMMMMGLSPEASLHSWKLRQKLSSRFKRVLSATVFARMMLQMDVQSSKGKI